MEGRPDYGEFDDNLRDIADLWLELMDEFARVVKETENTIFSESIG